MSKDKQAEAQVKKCETELKKPVSINNVKNMLELVFPVLIWLRSEGKAPKRIKAVKGKTDVDENGQLELDQDTESELDKEIESMKMKTAYAIFDRDVCKKGLLKLAAITKDSPKWANGAEYIKKLPDGCHWKNLWYAFDSYASGKVSVEEIDTMLESADPILKSIGLYLQSRHWNPALSRVKSRKLLMKALEKYFAKLRPEIVILRENQVEKENKAASEALIQGLDENVPEGEKVKKCLDAMNKTSKVKNFYKILDKLSAINGVDVKLKEEVGILNAKEKIKVYPCAKKDGEKLICAAARNCLWENRNKDIKTVCDAVRAFVDGLDKIRKDKKNSVSAWINGTMKTFCINDETTLNDLLDLATKIFRCGEKQLFLAALLREDLEKPIPTAIKLGAKMIKGTILGDKKGEIIRVNGELISKPKIRKYLNENIFNEKVKKFVSRADVYLFNSDSQWKKIKGKNDLAQFTEVEEEPEEESDSNKNSGGGSKPSNSNSSGGGSKPAGTKNPTDETSTKDNAAEAEKLEYKIEELKKDKAAKENERTKNKKKYEVAIRNHEEAEIYLKKDAYRCQLAGFDHKNWKTMGLRKWKDHFQSLINDKGEKVKDGFTASFYTAKYRLKQVDKAIDEQEKVIKDYEELQRLRADIKKLDEEIENTQKQLDALQND